MCRALIRPRWAASKFSRLSAKKEGPIPSSLYDHFLQSLAFNLKATVHVHVVRGTDRHHVVEAAIKAVGFCLRQGMAQGDAVFSTKGAVRLQQLDQAGALDEAEELG